ncbi:MAG: hypothetical protein ACI89U_001059 [Gammaproteobacteria bacterium]
MRIILFVATLLIVSSTIVSCTSTFDRYNPTVFPFQYEKERVEKNAIRKVVLAPVSIGAPVGSHLKSGERRTKSLVKKYLRKNGYEILPNYVFENAWEQAIRTYGNVYDPTTGRINVNAWRSAMVAVGEKLRKETNADAIIFADVIEHEITHNIGSKHSARWYGVTRKPSMQGVSGGVPVDFNWNQTLKGASLQVAIFDIQNLERLFTSFGGLDTLQEINLRNSGVGAGYIRRKKLLANDDKVEQGIEIAFHPFIEMKNYPGIKE